MLKKTNRVDRKTINQIFKLGHFINSPNLTFKFIKNTDNNFKFSFIAPKSVAKLAVKRNSLRRHGYNALKRISFLPKEIVGIFIYKKVVLDISQLENEIKTIFNKIN